jgi:hypothetical protein
MVIDKLLVGQNTWRRALAVPVTSIRNIQESGVRGFAAQAGEQVSFWLMA